jgi:hypothetical protein
MGGLYQERRLMQELRGLSETGKRRFTICHLPFLILSLVDSSLKCNLLSANGADCNSQGQVLSTAKHVAPGTAQQKSTSAESAQ